MNCFILRNNTCKDQSLHTQAHSFSYSRKKAYPHAITCLSLSVPSLSCLSQLWPLRPRASWSVPRLLSASAPWCRSCRSLGSGWRSPLKDTDRQAQCKGSAAVTGNLRSRALNCAFVWDVNYAREDRVCVSSGGREPYSWGQDIWLALNHRQ